MRSRFTAAVIGLLGLTISGCTSTTSLIDELVTSSASSASHSPKDRECLARAMFFESHRSSREGLIAVGTVVMNRVESDRFPDSVCEVVAQKNQFAPGVMSREMKSSALPDVMAAADSVLKGERHPKVRNAMFFHQAGLKFPYKNMHYVHVAGGNAFYEKRSRGERRSRPVRTQEQLLAAGAGEKKVQKLSFDLEQRDADAIGAIIAGTASKAAE